MLQIALGKCSWELREESQRSATGTEILEEIRQRTSNFAGVSVEIEAMEQGPGSGKPILLQLSSHDRSLIDPAITRIMEHIEANMPEMRDIDDSRALPGVEWNLTVDRAQAALFGADVSQVGIAVQLITNGVKVGEYRPDRADDGVDIRVRYPAANRGIDALDGAARCDTQRPDTDLKFRQMSPTPNVDALQRIDATPIGQIRSNVAPDVLASDWWQSSKHGSTNKNGLPNSKLSSAAPTKIKPNPWPLSGWPLACRCS